MNLKYKLEYCVFFKGAIFLIKYVCYLQFFFKVEFMYVYLYTSILFKEQHIIYNRSIFGFLNFQHVPFFYKMSQVF
jgi:hypothetical protein